MPCQSGPSYRDQERSEFQAQIKKLKKEKRKVLDELDAVTQLLCRTCNFLEDEKISLAAVRGLTTWWREHKEIDEARKAREAEIANEKRLKAQEKRAKKKLVRDALAKLTAEEREVLGLK